VSVSLYHGDCLEVLPVLPANSVDCVITDPPYFRVKGEEWDRQWSDPAAFIAWLEKVVAELARVLKPNGSLYLFASPKMAERTRQGQTRRVRQRHTARLLSEHRANHLRRASKPDRAVPDTVTNRCRVKGNARRCCPRLCAAKRPVKGNRDFPTLGGRFFDTDRARLLPGVAGVRRYARDDGTKTDIRRACAPVQCIRRHALHRCLELCARSRLSGEAPM
jgi:hypothetical protein